MTKKTISLLLLAAGLITLGGCASGESHFRADYDFSKIQKIAIVDVIGPVGSEGAKNQIGDFVAMELLKKGYAPIERSQVQSLLKEQQFQASDMTAEEGAVKAGKILNVPTVLIVNIPEFKEDISMTVKMLDVEDGSLLWVGSGSGTTGKTLGTILGAAAGAGGGAMVAGEGKSEKITGAVVGGVLGGATVNLLTPRKAQAAQKIVKKICKVLPSRVKTEKKKSWFGYGK